VGPLAILSPRTTSSQTTHSCNPSSLPSVERSFSTLSHPSILTVLSPHTPLVLLLALLVPASFFRKKHIEEVWVEKLHHSNLMRFQMLEGRHEKRRRGKKQVTKTIARARHCFVSWKTVHSFYLSDSCVSLELAQGWGGEFAGLSGRCCCTCALRCSALRFAQAACNAGQGS
jgi:hypothetical protein